MTFLSRRRTKIGTPCISCMLAFCLYVFFYFFILGSFGNGVLSYFTFLKWLFLLNVYIFILTLCFVIIPQALSTGEELPLESPQNFSDSAIKNASSPSLVLTNVSAPFVRKTRDNVSNKTEEEDNDKQCDLVKPFNYSEYTHKPLAQLFLDFITGVVSSRFEHLTPLTLMIKEGPLDCSN